jgi:hypothetical protein
MMGERLTLYKKKKSKSFIQISVQPAPEGPILESGGWRTVGSGWREFDGGYPLLKLDPKAHRICYLCSWPKFGLVNFV